MKLVNTSTIEGFDQIICALKEKYKGHVISVNKEYYNTTDLTGLFTGSNTIASNVETLYYGLLTSGTDNQVTLNDQNGDEIITIAPNSQIIEVFSGLDIVTTSTVNVQFRGIKIHIQGLTAIPRLEPFKYSPICYTNIGTQKYYGALTGSPYLGWGGSVWAYEGYMQFGGNAYFRTQNSYELLSNTDYLFRYLHKSTKAGNYNIHVKQLDGTVLYTENVVLSAETIDEPWSIQFNTGANTVVDIVLEWVDQTTLYFIKEAYLNEVSQSNGFKETRTSDGAFIRLTDSNKNTIPSNSVYNEGTCPI